MHTYTHGNTNTVTNTQALTDTDFVPYIHINSHILTHKPFHTDTYFGLKDLFSYGITL